MLADRVSTALAERRSQPERRYSADMWLSDYLIPATNQFSFGGASYPFGVNFTQAGVHIHEIVSTLPGYSAALRACPPAFAAQMVRALVLSQARFTFRHRPSARTPRRLFGTSALAPLEKPWTNATTGELLARMEWHAGLAGNAYVTNRSPNRLRVLRPDWVAIVYGSHQEPEQAAYALDGEIIGYVYAVGGLNAYGGQLSPMLGGKIYTLLPEEVAHFSPLPDPEGSGIGQSWITPALKDIQSDRAATEMKLRFWAQGSTPNMVVKGLKAATKEQFDDIVDMLEERHSGIANAFKTLYLTEGADATVVGSNFREMDLKNVQGASETRISSLSRVPASLLGIAEGLAGSSLNAGNFGMARRIFADTWVYPTLQDLAAALSPLVRVPPDAELWFDVADMPLLREDGKDAAEIEAIKAETITKYVREGFTADSAIAAVRGQDVSLLVHTHLVSVQLQAPGASTQPAIGAAPVGPSTAGPPPDFSALRAPPGKAPPPGGGPTTRSSDDEGEPDEQTLALIAALDELSGNEQRAAFDEALHPRNPKGTPGGGRFRSIVQRITDALESWSKGNGPDDPLKDFDREQLRLAAKARGLTLRRGASRDEIHAALLADLKANVKAQRETPKSAKFTLQGHVDPAKIREVEVENRIRAAYRDVLGSREPGLAEWVGLADLRERLAGMSREEQDAALRRMLRTADYNDPGRVRIIPIANTKALKPRDREAALHYGVEDLHAISFGDASPRPAPKPHAGLDVAVYRDPQGRPALFRENDAGKRGTLVAKFDDLAALEKWADDNGEPRLAEWARKEQGAPPGPSPAKATAAGEGPDMAPKDVKIAPRVAPGDVTTRLKAAASGDAALEAAPYKQWQEPDGPHADAVYHYVGGGYLGINADLRVGRLDDPRTKSHIKRLDEAMADSPLQADVRVVRGVRDPAVVFGDKWNDTDVTGLQWTEAGFASSSTNVGQTGRTYFTGNAGVRMEILVPKGTNALAVSQVGEAEVLLDRGLTYRVVRDDGIVDGVRHLVVEVVPARKEQGASAPAAAKATKAEAGSLAAKTIPQLRELAKQRGIKIPSGSRKADILRLLGVEGSPKPATKSLRVPLGPGGADDLAEEFYRHPNYTEQQIADRLAGLNLAELKKVARATNVELPRGPLVKTKAGPVFMPLKTITADELRKHIASTIAKERKLRGA